MDQPPQQKRTLRFAAEDELAWINERYSEIDFVPAKHGRDLVAVCEIDGEPVGLGRLVRLSATDAELGGMYIFEAHRGRGIAELIVHFLLEHATKYTSVWCLPFAHLAAFYQRFGFRDLEAEDRPPPAVTNKRAMCLTRYPQPSLLLVRKARDPAISLPSD